MNDSTEINWYSNETATFGDRVAAAREAQTIESWENDLSEPRANKLQMLSGVVNVSIPWLLTGDGSGVEPDAGDPVPDELSDVLTEMRGLRGEMLRSAERLGVLEKRLKRVFAEPAE